MVEMSFPFVSPIYETRLSFQSLHYSTPKSIELPWYVNSNERKDEEKPAKNQSLKWICGWKPHIASSTS
jgi:hypothetical protein